MDGIARGSEANREADRGLGTTFERFAIYNWLESVADRYTLHVVLEGPGDGVAGIPGIHSIPLARRGCEVTVALASPAEADLARRVWVTQGCLAQGDFVCVRGFPLPFPSRRFDLVWNFNRLPFLDPRPLVGEMARLSRRYVALVVPNRRNYGFPARRLYHRRTRLSWPYGNTAVMDPGTACGLLEEAGLREPEALPYFDSVAHADLHRRMHRLGWLERACPVPLQVPFAHHFAVLAVVDRVPDREDADA
jgi:hypothetical protein